jgi:uncharacterized protein YjbI with pentapeptide repeats
MGFISAAGDLRLKACTLMKSPNKNGSSQLIQEDFERQLFQMLRADQDELQRPYIQASQANDTVQKIFHDISKEELNRILAAHVIWFESQGKAGQRANFWRVNLQGANLARVNLQGANLVEADLLWVNSFGAELQGADLRGANLRESYLEEANLQGAILKSVNLQEAYLAGANLQGADLARANLQQANLRMANLNNANLIRANLQNANLEHARILHANLSFSNLQRANLKHTKILYTDLEKADLRGVKGLAVSQLSNVKNLSQVKLDSEFKRQIPNRPQSMKPAKVPKISVPGGAAEKKLPLNRQQNEKESRRQPRRLLSKLVFIASQNQYCKGVIKNINSFGAFIETNTQFYRQQMIKLEIPGTKNDKGTLIVGEVARSDLRGIGVQFKRLIQSNTFSQDMGGRRSGTDRRKLLFSEYYPEKRSGTDRRSREDRRKLRHFRYYKYGLQINGIIDNGGRRFTSDRRQLSFVLHWPENRIGGNRRSGQDRRTAFKTKIKKTPGNVGP